MQEVKSNPLEQERAREVGGLLKESENLFRRVFEEGPLGMAIAGPDFRFIEVNAAFCRMLGYTEEELISRTFADITHPEHVNTDVANIKKVYTGEIPQYHTQKRYIRKDGTIIWGDVTVSAIRDSNRKFQYCLALIDNITERKRMFDQLQAEKNKLQTFIDAMDCGVTIQDPDFNIIFQNEFMIKQFGNGLGKKCFEVYPREKRRCPGCPVKMCLKDGKTHTKQRILLTPSGKTLCFENVASPIKEADGKVIFYLELIRDITERKKTEEALKESEAFNSRLLESSPNPILVTNLDSSIRYANPATESLTGYTSAELIGLKTPYPWWPPEKHDEYKNNGPSTGYAEYFSQERYYRKKNGEIFWVALNIRKITDDGKAKYYLNSWVDITERKKAEEQVKYQAMLVDNVSDAVIASDIDFKIISWNKAAETIYGWIGGGSNWEGPERSY